jgi:polyisoprenoid-binding protein YceI
MTRLLTTVALTALALAACDDPADDATAAEVVGDPPAAGSEASPTAAAATGESEALSFSNEGSSIEFTGSKVTGSHDGGFREFSGSLGLDPATETPREIQVTIQTASIHSDDDRLTEHLKSPDFFNVAEMPTASFESIEVSAGGEGNATHTVTGRLTLHGQTQTIRFPATIRISDSEVTASAEFSIDRTDFGIVYPGMQNDLIRDGVVIRLSIRVDRTPS